MSTDDPFALEVSIGAASGGVEQPDTIRTITCRTLCTCFTCKYTCTCTCTSACTAGCPFDSDV